VEAILKAIYRFHRIQKQVLSGAKDTCRRLRDMQVNLGCGMIRRELPRAVIISLRGRHVNGLEN
jgi:hypothetical protein